MSSNLFWSSKADKSLPFCVYVITYSGRDMPQFYIGYSSVLKIEKENYHGSVSSRAWKELWNKTLEDYPELFRRKVLKTFGSREEAYEYEKEILKHFNAAKSKLFVNKSNGGTIVCKGENHPKYGYKPSEETRKKISSALRGKPASNRGKQMSQKQRDSISRTRMERRESYLGKTPWNKGIEAYPRTKLAMSLTRRRNSLRSKVEGTNKMPCSFDKDLIKVLLDQVVEELRLFNSFHA